MNIERAKHIIRLAKDSLGLVAGRLVLFIALCGFLTSCWLYFVSEHRESLHTASSRPLSRAAQAEGMRMSAEVLAAVLSKEAEKSGNSDEAISAALNRVYPELAESGYFVLWRGTVDVCSPLTPDTAGLDFGNRQDARGTYFVRDLEALAGNGGGFHSFVLSYDRPPGDKSAPRGSTVQRFESEFVAYATQVYGTDLHLTLWKPVDQQAFSLQAELEEGNNRWSLLGLCMSGLSFLGISVFLRNFRE